MRRIARFAVAVAATALLAGTAQAASIVLTSPGGSGVVPVYIWFEDSTREVDLLALQFDINLPDTGNGSLAATPGFLPARSARDDAGTAVDFPFDLNAQIGDPSGPIEVRVVNAASTLFDVNSLAARASSLTCLGPASVCSLQDAGLAMNRVFLGGFNMNYDGAPVYYSLPTGSIVGEGDEQPQNGTDPIIITLRTGQGPDNRAIEGLAPEPASLVLMGLALAGLGVARRRS